MIGQISLFLCADSNSLLVPQVIIKQHFPVQLVREAAQTVIRVSCCHQQPLGSAAVKLLSLQVVSVQTTNTKRQENQLVLILLSYIHAACKLMLLFV